MIFCWLALSLPSAFFNVAICTVRLASRTSLRSSRAIHFLRSMACSTARDAPVADGPPKLRGQGQHGAENFADGRNVVLSDPAAQLHELGRQRGRGVEYLAQ